MNSEFPLPHSCFCHLVCFSVKGAHEHVLDEKVNEWKTTLPLFGKHTVTDVWHRPGWQGKGPQKALWGCSPHQWFYIFYNFTWCFSVGQVLVIPFLLTFNNKIFSLKNASIHASILDTSPFIFHFPKAHDFRGRGTDFFLCNCTYYSSQHNLVLCV